MDTEEESMNIEEFADVIGADLIIRRYANQDNRYMAEFEHCETTEKDSPVLAGEYGNGKTAHMAVLDYVQKIKGKILVFNAYSKDRKEFNAPKNLEV